MFRDERHTMREDTRGSHRAASRWRIARIRKHERQQRRARSRAHSGEIAKVPARAEPDGIGW